MARLIGTAGHVDHGKTSLIQALTGIDADRLPEEKRRGMTIDVGFAYIDLPDVGRVSIVDVPGHEKFVTNMLVGALGIDVALLCVAADEGVKPQTREHLAILELLPVDRMVVALTRADLADADTRELAALDVSDLLSKTRFAGAPSVLVSVRTGEGVEQLRSLLAGMLADAATVEAAPWYLPIDRVFSVKGHGLVVTGTLAQGRVNEGDPAEIMPGKLACRVRGIQWHDQDQISSEKGRRTALNVSGVKVEDLHRGMAIGQPGTLIETDCLDARIRWIEAPKHGLRIRLSIGSAEAIGRVFLSDAQPDVAQLRLESKVAAVKEQPLIVRRYSPPDVLGGGVVLVPQAVRRRKSDRVQLLEGANEQEGVLEIVTANPQGVATDEVARRMGRTLQQLGSAFEELKASGKLLGFAGLWLTPEGLAASLAKLESALEDLHLAEPNKAMQPRERAIQKAGLSWAGKPLDRIMAHLAEPQNIRIQGTFIALPGFRVQLKDRQRALLDRVVAELARAGINVPLPKDLAAALNVPFQAIDEILALGVQAGEVVRVDESIWYPCSTLSSLKQDIAELAGGKPFAASDLRDKLATTRKYVIPLLEYFDATGFTMRQGDLRVIK
ncbi:MAG: Selenocysteine-specific elongation factor [Fimbriimonadaceae bacterium]|nr:Selenocysteine-specific elongation factor [Fimbriimonadaceae bacterium]